MRGKWRAVPWALSALAWCAAAAPTRAMPVFDGSNFAQNLVTAIEAVDQTLGQIQQYKLQILQFQQMVRDGVADVVYTWDSLESIYDQVQHLDEELAQFMGELHQWIKQLRTREYYRTSPCYGSNLRCYREEWAKVIQGYQQWEVMTTESQRRTLQVVLGTLELESQKLKLSQRQLRRLQQQAEGADGQWKAIQVGNMMTAHLAEHLSGVRVLLIGHHNMLVAQRAAELEREAQQQAADARFLRPMAEPSPQRVLLTWPR